jgi:uncharacterized protein (DUF2236 family)
VKEAALTDAYLDEMRTIGDPLADECVARIFARHDASAVQRVMASLVENIGVPTEGLPPELGEYLAAMATLPLPPSDATALAEETFAEMGPEILMVLGFYSLPASYAAKKGVHVLARTARLVDGPLRRVFETTQMVVDVMQPGGLGPAGKGLATVKKVRLMHAAVRHLLQHDRVTPWDAATYGVPINQEDLAGTLMTFSYLIIEGLERMKAPIADDRKLAWIRCWAGLGRLLGVNEDLIPSTVEEARLLTRKIQARQIDPSADGRELTVALLAMYCDLIPGKMFDGLAATLMRHFLPKDVADGLGIPHADFTKWIFAVTQEAMDLALTEAPVRKLLRKFNLAFIQAMLDVERGGTRPPFAIPDHLADGWSES